MLSISNQSPLSGELLPKGPWQAGNFYAILTVVSDAHSALIPTASELKWTKKT
jgi:hypothetical protein